MSTIDIDKAFVSPIDTFLYAFDASHAKSASQLKEIKKHQRIAELRDCPVVEIEETVIWEEF